MEWAGLAASDNCDTMTKEQLESENKNMGIEPIVKHRLNANHAS